MFSEICDMLTIHAAYAWMPVMAAFAASLAMAGVISVGSKIPSDWFYATMLGVHCISGMAIFYQARDLPFVSQMIALTAWVSMPLTYAILSKLRSVFWFVVRSRPARNMATKVISHLKAA